MPLITGLLDLLFIQLINDFTKNKRFVLFVYFGCKVDLRPYKNVINLNKKQDIRIYVPYRLPNGWTEWADIFLDTWVAWG